MSAARLSPLDSSFLAVESSTAHMHVGWAALFAPPNEGPAPSFAKLRQHIGRRLERAPRYRQKLAQVDLRTADTARYQVQSVDADPRHPAISFPKKETVTALPERAPS